MQTKEELLTKIYGFSEFKSGQAEVIDSVMKTGQTLGILPTATGKSLCYQLAGYMSHGTVLVVSPLLSLMEDQVRQLQALKEKRVVALNSQLSMSDKQWVLSHLSDYKFIFISPETLLQPIVLNRLMQLEIGLFVVDEAHCIIEWGIDFRPEYEKLLDVYRTLNARRLLALTATATPEAEQEIKAKLFSSEPAVVRRSVDRENISYYVEETEDKYNRLKELIGKLTGPGIVYFSSKKQAELISKQLQVDLSEPVTFYHADLTQQERSLIQSQYINGQIRILCATNAFGMGINKKDVRFVIHYHLPSSLEAYLQESGRSGRDGKDSVSIILYQKGDERIHHFLQESLIEEIENFKLFVSLSEKKQKDSLSLLSELQLKWLENNAHQSGNWDHLFDKLDDKTKEKKENIESVLRYLKDKNCRRVHLLRYFGEKKSKKATFCCDNCDGYGKINDSETSVSVYKKVQELSWEEMLKNLFNFG